MWINHHREACDRLHRPKVYSGAGWRRRLGQLPLAFGFAVMMLAACSGGSNSEPAADASLDQPTAEPSPDTSSPDASSPDATPDLPAAEPDTSETDASETTNPPAPTPGATSEPAGSAEPVATATEPVVRLPENPGTVTATNWIGRNRMDAESVELVWSPVDDADVYRIYRLPTTDADYVAIQAGDLDGMPLIYEGLDIEHTDRTVEPGLFLTYVLVAQVGNNLTSPRWTEALTVEDTTPPTPITGLVASETADGVLLEWQPVTDDVEFASYSVSLIDDEGRLRYIGGGADESLTSFLDPDVAPGVRIYVVVAVDFHGNMSESARIEITL